MRTLRTFSNASAPWLCWLTVFACVLAAGNSMSADTQESPGTPEAGASAGDFTTMSLEDLGQVRVPTVVGASKHEQKISEAPAAVSIVTQEDIKQFGYRTMGDLLRSVRGFYVTYDRAYNFTGLRGVNRPGDFGGRVLINIDGHRLNDPIYDSAFTHTDFLLDMDLVDRVEIIRGPGSSLYGNNAFFTVINVITRRGRELGGAEASASVGSYDTYSGRFSYGQKFYTNGVELLLSGTWLDSAGHDRLRFPEYSAQNNGVAENLDGSVAKSFYGSLSYGDFSLSGGYIDRQKDGPTAQFGTIFNDPRLSNRDVRGYGELKYAHLFGDDWSVQVRAYYDYYGYEGVFPFDYPPVTLNRDSHQARWGGGEALLSKTVWDRHRLTVGSEFRKDFLLSVRNFDVSPRATYVDSRRNSSSFGFYAQDEISVCTNLTINVGLRYDHFSTFGDTRNPRGAIIYNPWRGSTFKFLYGQAFRAPNAFELDYLQPTFKSNPRLGPETVRSYELVYEQGLFGNVHASGSVFLNQIKGLIGQSLDVNDGMNFFDNLDGVEVRGFDLEVEAHWEHGMRGRLSYTYAEARDTMTDAILDNSPRHLVKANFAMPLWRENIFAGLEIQGMSSRKTVQGNRVSADWVANATLYSRELLKGLEFSASVYNLLNKSFADPSSSDYLQDVFPQDGRSFRVKMTYKF